MLFFFLLLRDAFKWVYNSDKSIARFCGLFRSGGKMAKKPWGTITHPKERNPEFLMGYQKLSDRKINQVVDRLYIPDWTSRNEQKKAPIDRRTKVEVHEMEDEDIEKMVERLTKDGEKKATDRNRTGAMKEQGVVNTYAWKGWN